MRSRRFAQVASVFVIAAGLLSAPHRGLSAGETPSCNAGGPGATQCGISQGENSCSVTCGINYYACCNYGPNGYPTCKCT
jgi:hypothetical protein